jgi:hypothetical protein
MKRFVGLLLICSGVLLLSCQKEISKDSLRGNDLDSTATGHLSKTVNVYIPDNLDYYTSEYEYDNNDRLIYRTNTHKIKQPNGSIVTTTATLQFFRDSLGRITKIGNRPDTATYNYFISYESPVSSMINNTRLIKTTMSGNELIDSIVYSYGIDNKVIREDHYSRLSISAPLQINSYQLFNYDSKGNVIRRESFGRNAVSNQFEAPIAYEYAYDDKPNPLYHSDIGIIFSYTWEFSSTNNLIKHRNVYRGPLPTPNEEHVYHYLYDSLSRPVQMGQVGAADWKVDYYYQ